jgi:hypothetical protein
MVFRTFKSYAWNNWNAKAMNRCDTASFIYFPAEKMSLSKFYISIMSEGGKIQDLEWVTNLSNN